MKNKLIALSLAALIAVVAVATMLSGCDEPESSTATPDSPTAQNTTEESTPPPVPPTPPEPPSEDADDASSQAVEELGLYDVFPDFPKHFVTHGGRPGDESSSEYYLHATIEISDDGTMKGELFTNLESTDTQTIEHKSSWTGKIRENKIYKDALGGYSIYVDDVKYEKSPDTSENVDGKTINYVYGFGLDPENENRIEIFAPETPIENLVVEDSQQDIRQFLSMMRKDGEGDVLDCYLLRGRVDNCYISITDEEANMAPPEQSQTPEQ